MINTLIQEPYWEDIRSFITERIEPFSYHYKFNTVEEEALFIMDYLCESYLSSPSEKILIEDRAEEFPENFNEIILFLENNPSLVKDIVLEKYEAECSKEVMKNMEDFFLILKSVLKIEHFFRLGKRFHSRLDRENVKFNWE